MITKKHAVVLGTLTILSVVVAARSIRAAETAEQLLQQIGIRRGICVVVGDSDCQLAVELAAQSELLAGFASFASQCPC